MLPAENHPGRHVPGVSERPELAPIPKDRQRLSQDGLADEPRQDESTAARLTNAGDIKGADRDRVELPRPAEVFEGHFRGQFASGIFLAGRSGSPNDAGGILAAEPIKATAVNFGSRDVDEPRVATLREANGHMAIPQNAFGNVTCLFEDGRRTDDGG